MKTLNIKALGFTLGILFAFWMLTLGLLAAFFNWGNEIVAIVGSIYLGYDATTTGAVIGAIWGFVDGFFFGVLIAWLYNKFAK